MKLRAWLFALVASRAAAQSDGTPTGTPEPRPAAAPVAPRDETPVTPAPSLSKAPVGQPTISAAPTVTPAPSPAPTMSKAPTLSLAPTSIPTAMPTKKDRDRTYILAIWVQAVLSVGFFFFICCPCLYCFQRVFIKGHSMPDLGGVYASEWYDEHRGEVYLFAALVSIFNFASLYFASMAGADDEKSLKAFGLATIVGKKDTLYLGLFGYAHFHEGKPDGYYEFNQRLPNEGLGPGKVDYDYEFEDECKRFGRSAFSLILPAGLLKFIAVFCAYKRVYVTDDSPEYRALGTILEFGCFCAMLGETVQFYSSCFRALPNRGSRFYFPDPKFEDDKGEFQEFHISLVSPYVAVICISLSALLSLAVSWVHFRTPCWESEVADPEWVA